jgi:hypothetical protein
MGSSVVVTSPSTEAVRWFGRRVVERVLGVVIAST